MVDFNDSTTMTRPPKEVVNMMILQQLQDVLTSLEFLEMKDGKDRSNGLPELKSQLLSLITLIRTPLSKQLEKDKKPDIIKLRKQIYELDYSNKDEIYLIIDYIEEFLYNKDVTKWDTKEAVDRKDVWGTKQRYLG
jgi:hypothetical protein